MHQSNAIERSRTSIVQKIAVYIMNRDDYVMRVSSACHRASAKQSGVSGCMKYTRNFFKKKRCHVFFFFFFFFASSLLFSFPFVSLLVQVVLKGRNNRTAIGRRFEVRFVTPINWLTNVTQPCWRRVVFHSSYVCIYIYMHACIFLYLYFIKKALGWKRIET